jgi:hypothetical protein
MLGAQLTAFQRSEKSERDRKMPSLISRSISGVSSCRTCPATRAADPVKLLLFGFGYPRLLSWR